MGSVSSTFPNWLPQDFLDEFWQRRPLLIRQALPGYCPPLDGDELAGLACEENVESRIVLEKNGQHPWQVLHGPFQEQDFTRLPATHWTLLVQDVDKHDADVAALLKYFRFIPDWRIDDIMISYAAPGGSVGPHTDQYDVFLLQASGRRRWMIDSSCRSQRLMDGLDLRILAEFDPDREWLLEPGDLLYLPPGVPHHGIAEDPCMTISIGFRAPTDNELLSAVIGRHLEQHEERFHTDPGLPCQQRASEIHPHALSALRSLVTEAMQIDDTTMNRYLCEWLSETKPGIVITEPEEPLDYEPFIRRLQHEGLVRALGIRVLCARHNDTWHLYIDGETFPDVDASIIDRIDKGLLLDAAHCPPDAGELLYRLYRRGYYVFSTT